MPKSKKEKPVRIPLRDRISEETRLKIYKISGLLTGIFTVFTLVAVLSFLFTWKADQSLLSDPDMMSRSAEVSNWGGKLGYRWGHFLVGRCFGLGSFALVILLAISAQKLFYRKRTIRWRRMVFLTLSGAVIASVILAYASSLFGGETLFGSGLGGDCGAVMQSWMHNIFGSIVTGLILLVFVVLWLLAASGRFSAWFVTAGDREKADDAVIPNGVKNLPDDVNTPDAADAEEDADEADDVIPDEVRNLSDDAADDEEDKTAAAETGPADDGRDTSVVIEEGGGIDTDVKELPRINVRDELSNYEFPPLELLGDYASGRHEVTMEELERNNNRIRATLLNYRIEVESVTACKGPTVTLYKVTPSAGVRIAAIRRLEEDIALALGASGVRVITLADTVGIEVPNERPSIVPLKFMLNDSSFRDTKYDLPVAIGYTVTQKVMTFDLASAPHLLIAGATQQGKSVGLNVIISSLLYAKHPSEMKFVFIDPKMVEFNAYSKLLKHYLAVMQTAASEEEEKANAIVKTPKAADEILRSLCMEMDERYKLMSKTTANNIKLYNEKYKDRYLNPNDGHRFMPYLVVVIDEYADLVMTGGGSSDSKNMARSISTSIIRLAQKGRAAGIHVILATQRPSVDVITGLIKTNFPMRIAFRTSTRIDSQTILDSPGAEKLIGKGDMLHYAGVSMERAQCALVSMDEIYKLTDFIGKQTGYKECYNTPYYLPLPEPADGSDDGSGLVDMNNLDDMFKEAAEFVVINQKGSTSLLQRRFGMGYARAGKVMDQLEAAGVVGPQEGAKPRQVLISDLASLQSTLDAFC